jgi:hypothetical protein
VGINSKYWKQPAGSAIARIGGLFVRRRVISAFLFFNYRLNDECYCSALVWIWVTYNQKRSTIQIWQTHLPNSDDFSMDGFLPQVLKEMMKQIRRTT